jgi:exopolysaccharide production protein ExoQ
MNTATQARPMAAVKPTAPRHSFGTRSLVFLFWFFFVAREGFALIGDAWDLRPSQATAFAGLAMAFFVVATVFAAFVSRRGMRSQVESLSARPTKWIALFLLWSGVSLFWTHADSKMVALGYLCLFSAGVIVVIAQMRLMPATELVTIATNGFVAGASALVLIAVATYSGSGRLGDPGLLHPNTLGKETAIGALFAMHRFRQTNSARAKFWWSVVGFGLLCGLATTVSKTSLLAFVLASFIYFVAGKRSWQMKVTSAVLLILVAASAFVVLAPQLDSYSRQQHGAALETLSGRLPVWQETIEMIREHPIAGYGFLSFRDYGPQLFNVRVVHAHNEWLHIWFSLGLVGVVLAAGIYISYFRTAWRLRSSSRSQHAELALALLAMALVRGVTEADLTGLVFALPLLLLMTSPAVSPRSVPRSVALQVARPEWSRVPLARSSR